MTEAQRPSSHPDLRTLSHSVVMSQSNGSPSALFAQNLGPTIWSVNPMTALSSQKWALAVQSSLPNPPDRLTMAPTLVGYTIPSFLPARKSTSTQPSQISVRPASSLWVSELPQLTQNPRKESGPESYVRYIENEVSAGWISAVGTWKL